MVLFLSDCGNAGTPLGQRYASICAACSIAEHTRDNGSDALVILDDISSMVGYSFRPAALCTCAFHYPWFVAFLAYQFATLPVPMCLVSGVQAPMGGMTSHPACP